jgi:hypothetical protein
MRTIKQLLLLAALSRAVAPCAWAHASFRDIHVISFMPVGKPDRYTMVFDAETTDYGGSPGVFESMGLEAVTPLIGGVPVLVFYQDDSL